MIPIAQNGWHATYGPIKIRGDRPFVKASGITMDQASYSNLYGVTGDHTKGSRFIVKPPAIVNE